MTMNGGTPTLLDSGEPCSGNPRLPERVVFRVHLQRILFPEGIKDERDRERVIRGNTDLEAPAATAPAAMAPCHVARAGTITAGRSSDRTRGQRFKLRRSAYYGCVD